MRMPRSSQLLPICTDTRHVPPDYKNPHDALFRTIFGTPALMAEELRAVLPPALIAHLDLASLTPVPARFIDAQLQGAESDLLFSARSRVATRSSTS